MRGFGLTIEPLAGGAVCVALRGELDLEHAYTFDEELRRVERGRPHCLVLDLRCLSFLDSCGLARLLAITAVGDHFETVSEVPDELRAPTGLAGQLQ